MSANEASWDRIVRVGLGVVLLGLAFGPFGGALAIIGGIIGAILLVTGLIGSCPAYTLFNFSTKDKPTA